MPATLPRALVRRLLALVVTVAVAYGFALGLRFGLVERDDFGAYCDGATPAWWCALRLLVIRGFQFGVYGTASKNRNDLGPLALSKYRDMAGEDIDPADVVIIGDTVNDVLVAKHIGAKCIITLTGRSTYDEVAPHQPEYIFNDLSDTVKVLEAIYA